MVTRRRATLAATAAALLLALGFGGYAIVGAVRHPGTGPRAVAATPVPIISPDETIAPTPTPVSHDGLRVEVPELGINLPIVDGDGYNAPLYKAAHYPGTKWPGEGGRSVFYAHARAGMFGPLFGGRVGEHVQIANPDGSVRTYAISQYFSHWPVTDLSWLRPTDHEEVVLITCTTYNYNDPRIIAVGEPVS
jgi:LPXTG-site transpeptidase (sortase) family protein